MGATATIAPAPGPASPGFPPQAPQGRPQGYAVAAEHGALAKPLEELVWLHYEVTFGGADPEARLDRARALALAVHAHPGPPRGS
jgi:hypothetical protein